MKLVQFGEFLQKDWHFAYYLPCSAAPFHYGLESPTYNCAPANNFPFQSNTR